jgi:type I restriction enzyme S subunit
MTQLKKYKFSELYEMSSGISSKPEQAGHGDPFVSFKTVFNNYFLPEGLPDLMNTSDDEQKTYSIKEGDIFLTRTSESLDELGMSSVAYKDYPKATYSGFLKRLRPVKSETSYPKFMAFYLRSKLFRKTMNNNAIMTLSASFNEQIFSYLDLMLPEYQEQKKIGDFLFDIHQKIELNNRINAELEGMAKLIYDYWFVQFDFPFDFVQNRTADETSNPKDVRPYKSSGGKMVWNEELKKEVPEGWGVKRLSDLLSISNDSLNPLEYPTKFFRLYSIPYFDQSKGYKLEMGQEIKSQKFKINENHLLISKLNPKFNRVIYPLKEKNLICSTEFVVWCPNNIVHKDFLYQLALSQQFISHCIQSSSGTSNSHKRIVPRSMLDYTFAINECILTNYSTFLKSSNLKIQTNLKQKYPSDEPHISALVILD